MSTGRGNRECKGPEAGAGIFKEEQEARVRGAGEQERKE